MEASQGSNIADFAERAGNSFMLNYGDEVAATAGALPNILTGGRAGKDRQTILREIRDRQKRYAEERPGEALTADLTGAGIGALVPGTAAARLLGPAPGVLRSAGVSGLMAAPLGAVDATGRLEGDRTAGEYAEAAGEGAAVSGGIGALAGGVGNVAGRVVGPWARQAAQYLSDRGVRLTPGELIGGTAQRLEDAATSIPFVGGQIRARHTEGVESFNRGAWDEALEPMRGQGVTARMPPDTEMGHEAAREAQRIFDRRYGQVVPRMRADIDQQLTTEVANISGMLPQTIRPQFADAFRRHITMNMDPATGRINDRGLQDSLQGLRRESRNLRRNPGHAYDVDLADGLDQLRDTLERAAERITPPRTMGDFRRINQAYGRGATLRDAGSRVTAEDGIFSPAHLHNAVRSADQSVGKGQFARGNAPMQDYSQAAKTVMSRKVVDSGSPERAAVMAMLAAPGAILAPQMTLGAGTALASMGALYSRPGNRVFQTLATYSPATRMMLRRAIERATPGAAAATGIEAERQY